VSERKRERMTVGDVVLAALGLALGVVLDRVERWTQKEPRR
jgi:hypothetical protein